MRSGPDPFPRRKSGRFMVGQGVRGQSYTRRMSREILRRLLGLILCLSAGAWPALAQVPSSALHAAGPAQGFVDNHGVRIHDEDGGSGPGLPVIFVHGLAGDLEMWRSQLNHLHTGRRALALDLRGHGLSGLPKDGDYSISAMASDVLAVADAAGLKRFILVGHSMGGAVILAASQAAPARVAGLLFVDPAGDVSRLPKARLDRMLDQMDGPGHLEFMKGWFGASLAYGQDATRRAVLADLQRTSPDVVRACYAGLAAYSPVAALNTFEGPMLTVVLPASTRPSSYQNLAPRLPAVVMKGTSHWLMMDDPAAFNRIMDRFLEGVPCTGARPSAPSPKP